MIACAAGRFHLACRFTERKILIRLNTAIPRTAMYHCEGGATRDQPEFHEWSSGTLDSKITAAAGNIRLSNRAGHSREDWFNSRNRGGVVYPVLHGLEQDGALKSRRKSVNGRSRLRCVRG